MGELWEGWAEGWHVMVPYDIKLSLVPPATTT